ncbi:putative sphingosine-1-phosphate phosphatase [Trypanosoma theileri]|uniref:Putative sphingosine-1-phosphate phosphatase n=1 Tax=Trypanosoma theileri TaxID=67003 RepID=A0A1X0NUR9_9TRYP|nr:putative sphingosine-1-phosphate phosphatase [Trypanosoma theileri]ORC88233.1 putative sphingosine-1-phosphate phosphatase [Trypanosoma theileri]
MHSDRDMSFNSGHAEMQPDGTSTKNSRSIYHPSALTECVITSSAPTAVKLPRERIPFRSWYVSNYCNEYHVSIILKIQNSFPRLQPLLTFYFKVWSCTGEIEFYTAFIPLVVWLGMPFISFNICVLMCMSQYVTGVMKDMAGCPRPPCPPVQIRGRRLASKEYGYPSSHASHSIVFAYASYELLHTFFPDYPVLCWIFCIVFSINVSLSRLILGMHWFADLVAGWVVGLILVIAHAAFLESFMVTLYEIDNVMPLHFLVAFLILHILVISHAAPADACPCYLDSLRFLGATFGALFGYWVFHSEYGVMTARSHPEDVWDTCFSVGFLVQYLSCLFVILLGKEICSCVTFRILRFFFVRISREASPNRPRFWRRMWYCFSHAVRRIYWIRLNDSPSVAIQEEGCQKQRHQKLSPSADCFSEGSESGESAGYSIEISIPQHNSEEKVLMGDNMQLWIPCTHRHWWLWETQRCLISYLLVGFMVTYLCPVILRVFFGVQ